MEKGGIDDNVVVETNANQNNSIEVNRTGSGTTVIKDGTNTTVDANVVYYIHRTIGVPSSEQRGTLVDMSSLGRPPQPQRLLVPTTIIPLEVEPVRRGMEVGKTSIQIRTAVIGGRLKQPMLKIEPFLFTEMSKNPLTTPMVFNCRPQVDFDASDCNAKCHKRLHARNVDG